MGNGVNGPICSARYDMNAQALFLAAPRSLLFLRRSELLLRSRASVDTRYIQGKKAAGLVVIGGLLKGRSWFAKVVVAKLAAPGARDMHVDGC